MAVGRRAVDTVDDTAVAAPVASRTIDPPADVDGPGWLRRERDDAAPPAAAAAGEEAPEPVRRLAATADPFRKRLKKFPFEGGTTALEAAEVGSTRSAVSSGVGAALNCVASVRGDLWSSRAAARGLLLAEKLLAAVIRVPGLKAAGTGLDRRAESLPISDRGG